MNLLAQAVPVNEVTKAAAMEITLFDLVKISGPVGVEGAVLALALFFAGLVMAFRRPSRRLVQSYALLALLPLVLAPIAFSSICMNFVRVAAESQLMNDEKFYSVLSEMLVPFQLGLCETVPSLFLTAILWVRLRNHSASSNLSERS